MNISDLKETLEDILSMAIKIPKNVTKLPVDIFLDESDMFSEYQLPYLLFFRNSYNTRTMDFKAITVSDKPCLFQKFNSGTELNIFQRDLYKIYDYVIRNQRRIVDLSKCNVTNLEFFRPDRFRQLYENAAPITEMAKLPPSISGLKYSLGLDDNHSYVGGGHWYRVKVEDTLHNNNTRCWNTLTLNDYSFVGTDSEKYKTADSMEIKDFVFNNEQLIKDLADEKITFEYFLEKFKPKNYIEVNGDTNAYKIVHRFKGVGYLMVMNFEGKFNILNLDNELVSNEWFDHIEYDYVLKDTSNGLSQEPVPASIQYSKR